MGAAVFLANDVPPGETLMMAFVEVLVGMGEFAFSRPRFMHGRVNIQQTVCHREPEQYPHERFAHGGSLKAVVRIAPGIHAIAAARQHDAPFVAGVVFAAKVCAMKAQRAQPRFEPARVQARFRRSDRKPTHSPDRRPNREVRPS